MAGLALRSQVGGPRSGFSPKIHAKGQSHVTDAAACMLHYTAQTPSNMHTCTEHNITSGNCHYLGGNQSVSPVTSLVHVPRS